MNRKQRRTHHVCRQAAMEGGFTLLEVMIAVALVAIGFVVLFGSQSASLSRATEAKFNSIAPILAAARLAEVESGKLPPADTEGDFGDDFPDYTWSLVLEDIDTAKLQAFSGLHLALQRVDLTVSWSETKFQYTLSSYVRKKN